MAKIRNLSQLTESLAQQYQKLLKGEIDVDQADSISRMASTIILACKVQLDYNHKTENTDPIPFMSSTPVLALNPAQVTPSKPDLHRLVIEVIEGADHALTEIEVGDKLIELGHLPPDYFTNKAPVPGGPYAMIRGMLHAMSRGDNQLLHMSTNEEGRAVFQMKRAA